MNALLRHSGILFHSYSEIFFLHSRLAGALLVAVTFITPQVGTAGLLSVLAAYLFSRLIGMDKTFLESGFFTYNALLVGLSIGYLFTLTPLTLFLLAAAGVLTFVTSVMLNSIFTYYLKLPILSLPFVLVSSVAYLASYGYGGLYATGLYVHGVDAALSLPAWLDGFLRSLGAILFVPYPLAGAVIAAVLLRGSRILFLLALAGFLFGSLAAGLLEGNPAGGFAEVNHFNFILIAMALGGVFLVPAPRSYLIAAAGVAVAILLLSAVRLFWASYGIPAFTLPFNLVTLGLLYVLGSVGFPLVAARVRATPEETLDDFLTNSQRFTGGGREIALPFSGSWCVWQGFDGDWTHRGNWRHAYDFVLKRDGATHSGDGSRLSDYHAFGKPVLSPCRGRVVRVIDNLPDNPPGLVDADNNWGNLVVIESPAGYWVELSHFAHQSVRVKEGDWVEAGAHLGDCGNSGYSPQPHIHVQVQASAQIGAVTLPFLFGGYLQEGRFVVAGRPDVESCLEPLFPDRALEFSTAFTLDTRLRFRTLERGEAAGCVDWSVRMSEGGEMCIDSGGGRLFFARDGHSLYFYRIEGGDPWLALLFCAVPRLPLTYRKGMVWEDTVPLAAISQGWRRQLLHLARAFWPRFGSHPYRAHWHKDGVIRGTVKGASAEQSVEAVLHPRLGFSRLTVGERELQLEEAEA